MVRAVLIALPTFVVVVVVASIAGALSVSIKNSLAATGFAIPERFQETGLSVGSDPSVVIGGWAYLTWLGAGIVLVAVVYAVLAAQRTATAEDELEHLDAPPPAPGQGAGAPGQTMSPQMPMQQMPMQQFPQQMPMQQFPPQQFPQ